MDIFVPGFSSHLYYSFISRLVDSSSHMEFQGFPRIHSIFYAVFDIIKGTVVKHQVPEGSITPQNGPASLSDSITIDPSTHHNSSKTLIDFEAISEYIIPKKQLYKRLVTICTNGYKVMGCPVVLHDHERYRHFRNEFRFNLCFVFEQDAETSSYEAVVRKLSRVLEGLEVSDFNINTSIHANKKKTIR